MLRKITRNSRRKEAFAKAKAIVMSMELDREKILETFYLYSGEDREDEERAALCTQLCEESAEKIERALVDRREADIQSCQNALESWAAAEAFYHLTLTDEATAPERITADGVSVSAGECSQKAKVLLEEKRVAIASIWGEGGFYFGRA